MPAPIRGSAPAAKDAATADGAASATDAGGGANAPAASAKGSDPQAPGAVTAQPTQNAATDPSVTPAPAGGADLDHAAARAGASTATPTADQTDATTPTKANAAPTADNAPNTLGVLNAAATAPTSAGAAATTAAAGTAATGAVSIAGLPVAIAARAQDGSNQFEIRLDPPELGRIDVQLNVDGNGQVTSHITVDRPDTLALLQNQQPHLERALDQAGLKTADNGMSFTLRDQSFTGQNNGGNNNGSGSQSARAQIVVPDSDLPPVAVTQAYSRIGVGGGIDIRV